MFVGYRVQYSHSCLCFFAWRVLSFDAEDIILIPSHPSSWLKKGWWWCSLPKILLATWVFSSDDDEKDEAVVSGKEIFSCTVVGPGCQALYLNKASGLHGLHYWRKSLFPKKAAGATSWKVTEEWPWVSIWQSRHVYPGNRGHNLRGKLQYLTVKVIYIFLNYRQSYK